MLPFIKNKKKRLDALALQFIHILSVWLGWVIGDDTGAQLIEEGTGDMNGEIEGPICFMKRKI